MAKQNGYHDPYQPLMNQLGGCLVRFIFIGTVIGVGMGIGLTLLVQWLIK